MSDPCVQSDTYAASGEMALAPLQHPLLQEAIRAACDTLPISKAYLAALRDSALGPQPRLLLAVCGSDTISQRRLAALVAQMLPEELEMDLIELADDSLSDAVRLRCEPFYTA
jgi:hypothetical protein